MERKADGDGFLEGSLHWGRSLEEGKGDCVLYVSFISLSPHKKSVKQLSLFLLVDEEN